jgi:H/ACA ribonucleoprotein complex subunit 1
MAKNYGGNFRDKKQFSTETVHLGTYIHTAGDQLILKLDHKDIPYPNSPVILNKSQIGKVDEVFGPINDVYVAVKLDSNTKASNFRLETKFDGYKDKFMFKDRFLPREEVERKKEQNDKKNGSKDNKKGGNFNKRGNDGYKKSNDGFNKRGSDNFNKRRDDNGERRNNDNFNKRRDDNGERRNNDNFNKRRDDNGERRNNDNFNKRRNDNDGGFKNKRKF